MHNLATKIQEDLEIQNEETQQSNISYLPSGFNNVKAAIKTLSKLKKNWKIKVKKVKNEQILLNFEDELIIDLKESDLSSFQRNCLRDLPLVISNGLIEVSLSNYIKEAKNEEIDNRSVELHTALYSLLNKDEAGIVIQNAKQWIKLFTKSKLRRQKNIMFEINPTVDISSIIKFRTHKIIKDSDGDIGMIEMMISAIEDGDPLSTFPGFEEYSNLVGTKIVSNYNGVNLIYSANVSMSKVPTHQIMIDDSEIGELVDQHGDVKYIKNMIYPIGKRFKSSFFSRLKDDIDQHMLTNNIR